MREIKFRAWDKKEKAMVYDVIVKGIWKSKIDPFTWFVEVIKDFDEFDEPIYFNPYDVELMQYTGLKDKNGKEIYEGDVVECVSCKEKDRKYKVTWCDKFLGFVLEHKKEKYQISIFNDFKVIGNIYENPELLEEENNEK